MAQNELAGISAGWSADAANRVAKSRSLGLEERRLAEMERSNLAQERISGENISAMKRAANLQAVTGLGSDLATGGALYYGLKAAKPAAEAEAGAAVGGGANPLFAKAVETGDYSGVYGNISNWGEHAAPTFAETVAAPQSLTAAEMAYDPLLSGADALPAAAAESGTAAAAGFTPGPGTALALYQGARAAGRLAEDVPFIPREVSGVLKHPITGLIAEPTKMLGKAAGIKELGKAGDFLEHDIEENLIQKPMSWAGDQITDAISKVTGGSCIVYGYLYGKESRQVRTAMMFCGAHMDRAALMGYYSIGHYLLIPAARRWKPAERFIKRVMAEPFYRFMQYKIGHGPEPTWWQRTFARHFLTLCRRYFNLGGLPLYYPPGWQKCVKAAENKTSHPDLAEV